MLNNNDRTYIYDILNSGFTGYNFFSDEELQKEITERTEQEVTIL
jgi:hypothetical protein